MLVDKTYPKKVWVIIKGKPNKENLLSSYLQNEGFEIYYPKLKVYQTQKIRPLFPGYIFVKLSPRFQLHLLKVAPGFQKPLLFDEQLAALEEDEILGLKKRENEKGYIEVKKGLNIKKGEILKIKSGAFSGLEATVVEYLPEKERIRLLLNYFNREIHLEAPLAFVN